MEQQCTFVLDGHLFGIPVGAVQEVLREQRVTPVPLAAPEVCGLANLRGQLVTTLDLRSRLQLPPRPAGERPVSVVVRTGDGAAVSLVVDRVGDVVTPGQDSLEPAPETLRPAVRELLAGVCQLERRLLLVLDVDLAVAVGGAAA